MSRGIRWTGSPGRAIAALKVGLAGVEKLIAVVKLFACLLTNRAIHFGLGASSYIGQSMLCR